MPADDEFQSRRHLLRATGAAAYLPLGLASVRLGVIAGER